MVEGVLLGERAMLEYAHALQRTGGASSQPPPAVMRVLASKACRRAVMFGDTLTLPRCQEVLDALARCALPFQCAHGRPTVAPLLQLSALQPPDAPPTPPPQADAGSPERANAQRCHSLDALRARGAAAALRLAA